MVLETEARLQVLPNGAEIAERQRIVRFGFGEPHVDELFSPRRGVLLGEVVRFSAVDIGMKHLPAVVLEMPFAEEWSMLGDHFPAGVPETTRAEHLVVLRLFASRRRTGFQRVAHRNARQRRLLEAVDNLRHRHTAALEDGWHDVRVVVVLLAHLTACLDPGRPADRTHADRVRVALELRNGVENAAARPVG